MTEAFNHYRQLEEDIIFVRWINRGFESEEEDKLLDEMEQAWWKLNDQERELIEASPPRSLIRESFSGFHRRLVDSEIDENLAIPPRMMEDAA